MLARILVFGAFVSLCTSAASGCSDKELDASGGTEVGDACDPASADACSEGLSCEPVAGSEESVCAARVEIRGQVIDALDDAPIEGALVVAADELGAPVTAVVQTDADGHYTLPVSVRRDASGEIAEVQRWTLLVSADDYLAFPGALRPAIPIDAQDVTTDDEDAQVLGTIDNASTVVALIPQSDDAAGGVTVRGHVDGSAAAGTLVVAEGVDPVSLAVADLDGDFVLFNVAAGSATIVGYGHGQEVESVTVDVADADIDGVELSLVTEDLDAMAKVSGSVNIVNAPGGSATSVVLVPSSVFSPAFERGPVPAGLRAPAPPEAPSVTSSFEITGVSPGRYHVLAAFENDELVRDPDTSIAGTQIQQIEVGSGQSVELEESFKITEALAVVSPGAEGPELVDGAPVLVWADDSSEDRYEVVVRDALGEIVWSDDQVVAEPGSATVEVPYGGPALTPGMYYQFRATSWRDNPQGSTSIARTEDLRGVFVAP